MYKHTEYPTIPNLKPSSAFIPKYVQEKLDGANVRVIVPKDGSQIFLGTRKVILTDVNYDYKNFKKTFESKLKTLALEKMKPLIDALNIIYDEFVIYGELVGPSVFTRLNYRIETLQVFWYDLFLFSGNEKISLPWSFDELQNYLRRCDFETIPFQQYDELHGEDYTHGFEQARSFLNSEERVEGFVLRDDKGEKTFKWKSETFAEMETNKTNLATCKLKPTMDLYRDVENKYGGFQSMTPEKIVSLLLEELIKNYHETNEKAPTKNWILGNLHSCFIKFFPNVTLNKNVIDSAYKLL